MHILHAYKCLYFMTFIHCALYIYVYICIYRGGYRICSGGQRHEMVKTFTLLKRKNYGGSNFRIIQEAIIELQRKNEKKIGGGHGARPLGPPLYKNNPWICGVDVSQIRTGHILCEQISEYIYHRATARSPSLCNLTEVSVRYAVHIFNVGVCTAPIIVANFLI